MATRQALKSQLILQNAASMQVQARRRPTAATRHVRARSLHIACCKLPRCCLVSTIDLESWLRAQCAEYAYDLRGVFRASGDTVWPLTAGSASDLEVQLAAHGHLLPLPKEPAALANVLEVSIVDFLLDRVAATAGQLTARRGGERFYPDLEITGPGVDDAHFAIDIKVAQRKVMKKSTARQTQSRITLYTGNTYFGYPTLHWPGTFRPFAEYKQHIDVLGIYTLNTNSASRVDNLELIVQQPWKIASRQRSSTTREYIGAVLDLDALREGRGEFDSPEEFYKYWRNYPFRIGATVSKQLKKLLGQS
jgi:Restriction endonuclease EcoRV